MGHLCMALVLLPLEASIGLKIIKNLLAITKILEIFMIKAKVRKADQELRMGKQLALKWIQKIGRFHGISREQKRPKL